MSTSLEGILAGAIAVSGVDAFINPIYAQQKQEQKKDMIPMQEIERLMQRQTVDDILREEYDSGRIQKIRYSPWRGRTNFDESVYQKGNKDKMPVLVLFYAGDFQDFTKEQNDCEKREAIIFKELSKKYKGNIRFVVFEDDTDPNLARNNHQGVRATYGIIAPPSIALYSPFDLLKGETPERNNGEIKQIDILRGGPTADKWINPWIPFLSKKWIDTNLTKPNGEYVKRFGNSNKLQKIDYR